LAKTQRLIAAPLRSSALTFAPSSADAFETVNIDVDQLVVLEQQIQSAASGGRAKRDIRFCEDCQTADARLAAAANS